MKLKTCLFFLVFCILYLVCGIAPVSAADKLYFVHQDHLDSTSIVTNDTGEVVSKQVYYPYGSTRSTIDHQPLTIERQYTSQVSDIDQTGLYYYNARYYNPLIAKFTQADTLGDGLNRYSYVGSNPIIFTDPSGHQGCDMSDYYCRHRDELIGSDEGGGFWDSWAATLDSYNTYVDMSTTSPTAVTGRLTVGAMGLIPLGGACLLNPVCAQIAAKAAAVVDVIDTAVDTVMCVTGDLDACGYIANHIPGAGLADEIVENLSIMKKVKKHSDLPLNASGAEEFLDEMYSVVKNPEYITHQSKYQADLQVELDQYNFVGMVDDQRHLVILRDIEGKPINNFNIGLNKTGTIYSEARAQRYLEKNMLSHPQVDWSSLPTQLKRNWAEGPPSLEQIRYWDLEFEKRSSNLPR